MGEKANSSVILTCCGIWFLFNWYDDSLTSIPSPFPGFLDRRLTSSYTLSYLPFCCKSSNSLHFSFHHFSLASSVVLRNLLFNLLYSCLALSVLWCFHFLRSSISSTISLVRSPLATLLLCIYLDISLLVLSWHLPLSF